MNVFKLQVYTEIKCLYNCDGMNERKVNIFLLSICFHGFRFSMVSGYIPTYLKVSYLQEDIRM